MKHQNQALYQCHDWAIPSLVFRFRFDYRIQIQIQIQIQLQSFKIQIDRNEVFLLSTKKPNLRHFRHEGTPKACTAKYFWKGNYLTCARPCSCLSLLCPRSCLCLGFVSSDSQMPPRMSLPLCMHGHKEEAKTNSCGQVKSSQVQCSNRQSPTLAVYHICCCTLVCVSAGKCSIMISSR